MREDRLVGVDFLSGSAPLRTARSPAAARIVAQLRAYLRDPRAVFPAPDLSGASRFRQRVWRALRRIPAGETRTYGALARELGTSARAVGGACRANPVALVVPCHRVTGGNDAGGFMGKRGGFPMQVKRWLLMHEGAG